MSQASPSVAKEIGTLWTGKPGESHFVGSSSGVFFVQTVQNAFSSATSDLHLGQQSHQPLFDDARPASWSPDWVYGNEQQGGSPQDGRRERATTTTRRSWAATFRAQRSAPSYDVARQLAKLYFQTWHPLTPFLHGPSFLRDLEGMCLETEGTGSSGRAELTKEVVFQCVCHIASLDAPELQLQDNHDASLMERLLPALGFIAIDDSLASIQALLSCQLYFVAKMSFGAASITGGLISRAIMKAGLHRCPYRYPSLTSLDRDMRKRAFWSAYVLDRFVSQALGHPLSIQDSDVDVCPPGTYELHEPVLPRNPAMRRDSVEDTAMHLPLTHPERQFRSGEPADPRRQHLRSHESPGAIQRGLQTRKLAAPTDHNQRLGTPQDTRSVLSEFVCCSRLLGRTVETFHKSIHIRLASAEKILLLKADIDAWVNDSMYALNNTDMMGESQHGQYRDDAAYTARVFLMIFHQHLILFVHRPSLSLDRASPEFQAAIQKCVGAAKSILQILSNYVGGGLRIFWPGHLLAVWMSGLVIAFAGRINAYDISKAAKDISQSVMLLKNMSNRWRRAVPCHSVLSQLLESITEQEGDKPRNHDIASPETPAAAPFRPDARVEQGSASQDATNVVPSSSTSQHRRKRTRLSRTTPNNTDRHIAMQQEYALTPPDDPLTNDDNNDAPRGGVDVGSGQEPALAGSSARSRINQLAEWPRERETSLGQAQPAEWPDFSLYGSTGLQSMPGNGVTWQMDGFDAVNQTLGMGPDGLGWESLQHLVTDVDWGM